MVSNRFANLLDSEGEIEVFPVNNACNKKWKRHSTSLVPRSRDEKHLPVSEQF